MTINQPAAIGDILFLEPYYRHVIKTTGKKPTMPVRDHLMHLQRYINTVDMVPLSKAQKDGFDMDSTRTDDPNFISMRFANPIVRGLDKWDYSDYANTMPDKYILAGLDPNIWNTLDIQFNESKCMELLELLTEEQWDDYVLVNEHSQAGNVLITPKTDMRVIKMREIPGFTVLDWAFVMLHAAENHHVSTSTFYVLQAIKNKYDLKGKVFMYARPNADGLLGISKLKPTFEYTPC